MPNRLLAWIAERQRALFEAENLEAARLHREADRAGRRHATCSGIIEYTPAMLLAGSAARIEGAQHYYDADSEVSLTSVRNVESVAR
jgi:hypothetical protein